MRIKGYFKRYIFKSDSGYVVGLFRVVDIDKDFDKYKNKTITFTGYFHELNESDCYSLEGDFVVHNTYGEQFNVSSYDIVLPDDRDHIIGFLSSDLFPRIGEAKASKIVDVLGLDCLNVILNNPSNLLLVPGVNEKQKDIIYENLRKYQYSFEVIVMLTKLGFSMKEALTIYNHYKDKTMDIVKGNPYSLIDSINDINFKKIEKVRGNLDISDTDFNRVKSAIVYTMEEICFRTGNTYLLYNEIITYTNRLLFFSDTKVISDALDKAIEYDFVRKIDEKYFLTKIYLEEEYIARRVFNLANSNSCLKVLDKDFEKLEKHFMITYNEEQKEAISKAISNNFLIITGGPGTGKTTIIKAICNLYQNINKLSNDDLVKDLVLLAPTGRASKRMMEETNLPASTIHRFLKWNKDDNSFGINSDNKSDVRVVIIDEASMIDTDLFYNLLLGLRSNTKIILIGDYNQLPSVGAGQVLKDLIDSECVNTCFLKTLYRRDEASSITLLSHAINCGDDNLFDYIDDDFVFVETQNVKEALKKYVLGNKDNPSFQVLAPIYRGDNGIDDLNLYIRDIINPKGGKNEILHDGVIFREGDKVIQLVNSVEDNVFNGDIGKIIKISNKKKEIYVDFDYDIVRYTPANFSNLKLAYTISIHKSQGSEFDTVLMVVLSKYNQMMYKKLIYTGITRSKNKLIIVGEKTAFLRGVKNERENNRRTFLKNLIISCINN